MSEISTAHVRRIDDSALHTLFIDARTANSFSEEPVGEQTLHELYELTKFGPTAMNAQPLRLVFVASPEAKARLLPYLSPGNQAKTEQAPVTAIVAADHDFVDNLGRVFPHAPGVASAFEAPESRPPFATMNASMQFAYLITAARSLGLVAGPMGGFDKAGVDEEFFAGTNVHSIGLVNLGYPGADPWMERLPRLDFDEAAVVL